MRDRRGDAQQRDFDALTPERLARAQCKRSPAYFIHHCCQVHDATSRNWLPFHLWPAQTDTLQVLVAHREVVILKARQLGFSWLTLGWCLWNMLQRPAATILLFSQREDEAIELLNRLRDMHAHLPNWCQHPATSSDKNHWRLENGSRALAFSTTSGGRSYTGSIAVIDEADYGPDLGRTLDAVKSAIDAGGQIVLLSTANKDQPESEFKRIFRAASEGRNSYAAVFHGWRARPGRDQAWYAAQQRDKQAQDGTLDGLYAQYPETADEALAPRSLDKLFAPAWLAQCFVEEPGLVPPRLHEGTPAIPGLVIFRNPLGGHRYVIGIDPAEGNPTSDDSALEVLDMAAGEQVASLAGKFQPDVLAAHADAMGNWYHRAPLLVEKNNHGHAVLLWLKDHSRLTVMTSHDGQRGWLNNSKGKALLYDRCATVLCQRQVVLHHRATYEQLQSLEWATLRAPNGQHDDRAMAFALAVQGCGTTPGTPPVTVAGTGWAGCFPRPCSAWGAGRR
ncbi:MAG: hypothetical protein K2R98_14025 [Gemmataceae bacterium]|nr:hypothetical protein [Gemmataceae bacterium]